MKASPAVWTGRVLTALFVLFMAFDVTIKLLNLPFVDEAMMELGWGAGYGPLIGGIELAALALYLFPRTSLFGAVVMTGLLGGAIASQLRVSNPLFSHILFGVWLALFMWGGLWLRDPAIRTAFPFRRSAA